MALLLEVVLTQGVTDTAVPDQGNFAILEKNGLRDVRAGAANLLRPQDPSRARPFLWRHPCGPGDRDPACLLPELRPPEAREAAPVGQQSLLHQAVPLLRRPPLSGRDGPGCGSPPPPPLAP